MKRLALSRKKVLFLAVLALAVAAAVLAGRGTTGPGPPPPPICKHSTYTANQPIVVAKVDATASTQDPVLRSQYVDALDAVAAAATAEGAYFVVDTFGSVPAKTKTLCATSTRISGAAPLFVTARTAELRRELAAIARRASKTNEGARGSAIYGALVGAVQEVSELRSDRHVAANIVIVTDGDEATKQAHLRLLLESGATNTTIVSRIVGKLPLPDARGMSIQMEGIGRLGNGRPISTTGARRMVQIWQRICGRSHPVRCSITTDMLTNLTFGR
jgi:hypothetical protein